MLVNLTILLCIFPVFIISIFIVSFSLCFLAFKLHLFAVHEGTVKVEEGLVALRYLIGQYSVSNENEMLSVFVLPVSSGPSNWPINPKVRRQCSR